MLKKILFFAVTSGLAARAYKAYLNKRDGLAAPTAHPEALKVWEDEGGALRPQPGSH
jgi:hypothetical protein